MKKLIRLGKGLNAFKLRFEDHLLNEIRNSYQNDLKNYIDDKNNKHLYEGGEYHGEVIKQSNDNYYVTTYDTNPLLWVSCNNRNTYDIYRRFFDMLEIEDDLKNFVDYDEKIIMYCGFFVIGNQAPEEVWHVDYFPGANAYTLITPLYELDNDHGNLLYEARDKSIDRYKYALNEAIIFGDHFEHSTEPYRKSKSKRILLSLTFGTDKIKHWDILKDTIGNQSNFMILPCGHQLGSCNCI